MRMDRHAPPHPRRKARTPTAPARAFAIAAIAAFAAPAHAGDCLPKLDGAWIRMPPAGLPMMAGYARISNPCEGALVIVGAHSDAFADTSLHETRVENGMSRMRATPALRLAPGGSAVLEPGGFHLMLMNPVKPLHAGARVDIEFTLEDGRRFSVPFEARPIAMP
jgi:copper(I)-binding protein